MRGSWREKGWTAKKREQETAIGREGWEKKREGRKEEKMI